MENLSIFMNTVLVVLAIFCITSNNFFGFNSQKTATIFSGVHGARQQHSPSGKSEARIGDRVEAKYSLTSTDTAVGVVTGVRNSEYYCKFYKVKFDDPLPPLLKRWGAEKEQVHPTDIVRILEPAARHSTEGKTSSGPGTKTAGQKRARKIIEEDEDSQDIAADEQQCGGERWMKGSAGNRLRQRSSGSADSYGGGHKKTVSVTSGSKMNFVKGTVVTVKEDHPTLRLASFKIEGTIKDLFQIDDPWTHPKAQGIPAVAAYVRSREPPAPYSGVVYYGKIGALGYCIHESFLEFQYLEFQC